jgi:predicted DNA-binding transcriptional regulator AlpA
MSDTTNDILAALVAATPERKAAALRALRGEFEFAEKVPDTEAYLTLRDVGRRLGISACSLWRYGVPGHELGGRRRFRMSEVEAYLASDGFKRRAQELKEDRREKVSTPVNGNP